MRPTLMIACPRCGKPSNEYNWTLKTAAYFSRGEETCPTFIQVMLDALNSPAPSFEGYRLLCPLCNQGSDFEEITLPPKDEILSYAEAMGDEYCEAWI